MTEIEIGGAILELPDGASPEAIQRAVAHFRTTPEFDKLIDRSRGAPAQVRMMVGSSPIQDRLANIRRFYPDAVPYGDQNFVFTDPESGRATLYNPEGFDAGDLASIGREASQFVGGAMGAVAGAPFGGPLGSAVGAGAGAAAGGAAFDAVMNFQGRVDTRGALGTIIDGAVDFGANAVGQRLGEMIGLVAKKAIGGAKPAAQRLVEQFRSLGIDPPPAGAVSGSRAVGSVETMLANTPTSAPVMQAQAERVLGQISAAADDIARQMGAVRTQQGAGQVIREAAKGAAERFGLRQAALYDEAFDLIGEVTPVRLEAVAELGKALKSELARAPSSLQKALGPVIRQVDQLMDDAMRGPMLAGMREGIEAKLGRAQTALGGNAAAVRGLFDPLLDQLGRAQTAPGIEFAALRQLRSIIGRQIDEPILMQGASAHQAGLKRLYGALTEDLSRAAQAAGPEAAKKLAAADRFTRMWVRTAADTMRKLDAFDADEKAFRFAMSSARDGGTALTRMRRHFQPEEWDTVAASVLHRLGRATPGAQDATGEAFSIASFMTNWSRLAPEAKKALFGGNRYAALAPKLDDLVAAASTLKGMERLANSSNTGHVLIGYATLSTVMGALGGLATGDIKGAAGGVAAGIVGPRLAAKLITSPAFVDWLTRPVTSPSAITAHFGRLLAIAEAEPAIREEIHQLVEALRAAPEPPASPPPATTAD